MRLYEHPVTGKRMYLDGIPQSIAEDLERGPLRLPADKWTNLVKLSPDHDEAVRRWLRHEELTPSQIQFLAPMIADGARR